MFGLLTCINSMIKIKVSKPKTVFLNISNSGSLKCCSGTCNNIYSKMSLLNVYSILNANLFIVINYVY